MMQGAAQRVAQGFSDPNIRLTTALPPREQQLQDAAVQWNRFSRAAADIVMPDAAALFRSE